MQRAFILERNNVLLLKKIIWFSLFTLLISTNKVFAQLTTVSYTEAQNITAGYGSSELTVKVQFSSSCSGTQIQVKMPVGVTYVASSAIATTNTTAGLGFAEYDISDLRNPVFNVTGALATGDVLEFKINRQADCDVHQGGGFDSVYVSFSGGSCINVSKTDPDELGVKNYNVYVPTTPITPPAVINDAVLGTTANRIVKVTNGGVNSISEILYFFVVYPDGAIENINANNAIDANGTSFIPVRTNGDTLFYEITGSVFGSNNLTLFENGESVTITEPIKVVKCGTSNAIVTTYGSAWGRTDVCHWTTSTGNLTMAAGVPAVSLTRTREEYSSFCEPFDVVLKVKNSGAGNAIAGAMYNVNMLLGERGSTVANGLYNLDSTLFSYTNLRIRNVDGSETAIPFSWVAGTNTSSIPTKKGVMDFDLTDLFPTTGPKPIGLEDLDGDGFYDDLSKDSTLHLVFTMEAQDLPCDRNRYHTGYSVKVAHETMCGDSKVQTTVGVSGEGMQISIKSASHIPANVLGGKPFQATLRYSSGTNNTNDFRTANSRWRWKIILTDGFSLSPTPNALYGSNSTAYNIFPGAGGAPDTLTITSPNNVLQYAFINLQYNCGVGGVKHLPVILEEINDSLSSPICDVAKAIDCETLTTEVKCPSSCSGVTVYQPVIRRSDGSLGWVNDSMKVRQVADSINAYDLMKAMYMDTLLILGTARQNAPTDNLHVHFSLPKTSGGVSKLNEISATAKLYRGGLSRTITGVTDLLSSTASNQVFHTDFSSSLTGGGLLAGDSIVFYGAYVVAINDELPKIDVQSGGNFYIYNEVGGVPNNCQDWVPEMYLVGTKQVNRTNAFEVVGCESSTLGGSTWKLARRFDGGGLEYYNEFRPIFYIDSVVLDMPSGYNLNYVSVNRPSSSDNPIIAPSTSNRTLTANYVNGSVFTYINDGTWPLPDVTVSNKYGNRVLVNVSGNCATAPTENINVKVYIRDYYYAYAENAPVIAPAPAQFSYILHVNSGQKINGQDKDITYSNVGKPDLTLTNLTGAVQGVEPEQVWRVRLGNAGQKPAPYVWIAVADHPTISVTEVNDGVNPIAAINYPGGKMYQLNTVGIAGGATKDYNIKFNYTKCNPDTLLIFGGWNCTEYPTEPSAYICEIDSLRLPVIPEVSEIQLAVQRHPGDNNPISLCQTDSTIIIVNSAQSANLIDPYLTFTPPQGITISTNIAVEYPLNSGNYELLPVTSLGGGSYKIDLSDHTLIAGNGIKGTTAANNNEERQAKVKIDFSPGCEFVSGTSFGFQGFGKHPCGDLTINNGVMISTNELQIAGATPAGDVDVKLDIGTTTVFECGNSVTLSTELKPSGEDITNTDTLVYTIPAGLVFNGNLTAGYNAVISNNTIKIGLKTILKGSTEVLSFDVIADGGICGNGNIIVNFKRPVFGLMCGTVSCTNASAIIAKDFTANFYIEKPELVIVDVEKTSGSFKVGSTYTADVTIQNNSIFPVSGMQYRLEAFCGNNLIAFSNNYFPVNISANDVATANMTFVVPASPVCQDDDLVSYRILPKTSSGDLQCLCDSTEFISAAVLPMKLLSFDAEKINQAAKLTWTTATETNNKGFEIERSNNSVDWVSIGFVKSQAKDGNSHQKLNYNYKDENPLSGVNFYRLKQTGFDNSYSYSLVRMLHFDFEKEIEIYPNPTQDKINIKGLNDVSTIKLFDFMGRELVNQKYNQTSVELSLKHLPEGMYLLKVISSNGSVHSFKVNKQ